MSVLLRKEVRLLLPAWVVALVAATAPAWRIWDDTAIPLAVFGLGILLLALAPFGQEINFGTLGQLLAQPEARLRFWTMKVGLSAVALVSAWMVLGLCGWMAWSRIPQVSSADYELLADMLRTAAMIALLAFVGGLWTTLLFRNMAIAFWITVLAPMSICAGAGMLFLWRRQDADLNLILGVFYLAMIPYVLGAFWFARKLFLEAQDVAWTGTRVALPQIGGWRWLSAGFDRKRGPWSALARKEWQLQSGTLSLVPLLALVHLGVLALCRYAPRLTGANSNYSLVYLIWLVVPVVLGCVAVAEERRLNTLPGLLCLPVRKRGQFALKFAIALALGVVLGAVVPWLLEGGTESKIDLWTLTLVAAALTSIAFFASTLTSGMLQAATAFICLPVIVGLAFNGLINYVPGWEWLWFGGPHLLWLAVAWVVWRRALRNYQCLEIGRPLWLANLGCLAAVLASACLLPAAIYQRPWEFLMSLEPAHGPPRLSAGRRAEIEQDQGLIFVLLPDGRLWGGQMTPPPESKLFSSAFARTSNWVSLAMNGWAGATAAIQSDGTLWAIGANLSPTRMGADADWKEVVGSGTVFLALKQNGTLWGWGLDDFGLIEDRGERPVKISTPKQIGSDSDWAAIYAPSHGKPMATKRDGRLLRWDGVPGFPGGRPIWRINPKATAVEGTNWVSLTSNYYVTVGVQPDGSLWSHGSIPPNLFDSGNPWSPRVDAVRIGTKSDWTTVAYGTGGFYGLEADGALWQTVQIKENVWKSQPRSKYSDWIAVSAYSEAVWALAKDGTLCGWLRSNEDREWWDYYGMLRPTRRPVTINILDAK